MIFLTKIKNLMLLLIKTNRTMISKKKNIHKLYIDNDSGENNLFLKIVRTIVIHFSESGKQLF